MSYTNTNGLVDGCIPEGQPCPFAGDCKMKTDNCPVEGRVKANKFSCALARLNSLISEGKKEGHKLPLLEKVRDNLGK